MNKLLFVFMVFTYSNVAVSGSMENLLDNIKDRNKKDRAELRVNSRGDNPRKHIIDPYRKERAKNKGKFYEVCKGKEYKSAYAGMECIEKASEEFTTNYPDRGTDKYGEKFYAKLSKEQGKTKRDELLKQLDWVSFYPKSENKDIELTVDHLRREITYIERYVMKIKPRLYETR